MKITLTSEVVNKYAPYVRISTTKANPNTGSIRVSNSGARWSLSSTDFAQLFKVSIFMMAYSAETVDSIRKEYDLRKDVEFEVPGISPIEVIQLSESAVNREVPKGGRPKPQFANLGGELIIYGTQPRKVTKGSQPVQEVEEKVEVSDDSSVRFHNAGETVLSNDLEKELENLKTEYKRVEDSLKQAEERIQTFEQKEKEFALDKIQWESEKSNMEDEKKATSEYINTLEKEHAERIEEVRTEVRSKQAQILQLSQEQDNLKVELEEAQATLTRLKDEKKKNFVKRFFSGLKKLFGRK
jgi:hypothetical protein